MSTDLPVGVRYATAFVGERPIDQRGMGWALREAIQRVLKKLGIPAESSIILLDGGLKAPDAYENQRTIIGGDESELLIALASIVAKVRRDRYMCRLAGRYPAYGFEVHKGYGTREHRESISLHGPSVVHRMSFLGKILKPKT